MITFRIVPLRSGSNLSADVLALVPFVADLLLNLVGDLALLFVLGEDCGAVLGAGIRALPVQGRRVVHLKEVFDELTVAHFIWVEDKQQTLGMTSTSGADRFVRRRFGLPARISYAAVEKTLAVAPVFSVQLFQAPETAASNDRALCVRWPLHGC